MENKRVLLVDDDNTTLEQMGKIFNNIGFHDVMLADGGDTAWNMLRKNGIDCIVAAYEMEEMSGLALLKITRREDNLFEIPFFLTDKAFTKMKVIKAGKTGVTGLIVMPCEEKIMRLKIWKSFGDHSAPVVQDARNSVEHGLKLIKKQKYGKAIEVFKQLTSQKKNPEYYFNIGYIKTAQGKHAEAIEAFSMATRLDRFFAKAYEEMGRVYKLMGDFKKAEEAMHHAAQIYMDADRIGDAEDILNEIIEVGTDSLNIFNTLGVLYRKKGDFQTALDQYKKALKVHPDEPYIYYNIGRLYLDMKDIAEAKNSFLLALEKDQGFDEAKQVIKAIDLGMV